MGKKMVVAIPAAEEPGELVFFTGILLLGTQTDPRVSQNPNMLAPKIWVNCNISLTIRGDDFPNINHDPRVRSQ